ncbi:hypothetical protein E2C01_069956 [Portunus trituberculatus]|uniref:Uncharacterized protein n=1 Tax=Portunus trituberculatus TaxID=210409 RepID=A0A5B7I0U7_PORTR|nr:hypothetical protein [Portunus trituberculatus]
MPQKALQKLGNKWSKTHEPQLCQARRSTRKSLPDVRVKLFPLSASCTYTSVRFPRQNFHQTPEDSPRALFLPPLPLPFPSLQSAQQIPGKSLVNDILICLIIFWPISHPGRLAAPVRPPDAFSCVLGPPLRPFPDVTWASVDVVSAAAGSGDVLQDER